MQRARFLQLECRLVPILVAVVEFSQFQPGDFPIVLESLLGISGCGLSQLLLEQARGLPLETKRQADTTANQVGIVGVLGDATALVGHHQGAQGIEGIALKIVIQRGAVAHVLRLLVFLFLVVFLRLRVGSHRVFRTHGAGQCQQGNGQGQWGFFQELVGRHDVGRLRGQATRPPQTPAAACLRSPICAVRLRRVRRFYSTPAWPRG